VIEGSPLPPPLNPPSARRLRSLSSAARVADKAPSPSRSVDPPVIVRSPLLTQSGAIRWLITGFGMTALGAALWAISYEPGGSYSPWIIVAGEAALACIAFGFLAKSTVLRVEIGPLGVIFVYLLRRDRGEWVDILPGRSPSWRGVWVVRQTLAREPQLHVRRHFVSTDMGRAIVLSPYHETWNVPDPILASIGIRSGDGAQAPPGGSIRP
jgi:hypothetical protein